MGVFLNIDSMPEQRVQLTGNADMRITSMPVQTTTISGDVAVGSLPDQRMEITDMPAQRFDANVTNQLATPVAPQPPASDVIFTVNRNELSGVFPSYISDYAGRYYVLKPHINLQAFNLGDSYILDWRGRGWDAFFTDYPGYDGSEPLDRVVYHAAIPQDDDLTYEYSAHVQQMGFYDSNGVYHFGNMRGVRPNDGDVIHGSSQFRGAGAGDYRFSCYP